MAKSRSILELSGKLGEQVHVDSKKYGQYTRRAAGPAKKKAKAALAQQYNRTRFLNGLAGELNTVIGYYSGILKSSTFYHALQKRFRGEPANNRFLLLLRLKGLDINPQYPFSKMGNSEITLRAERKKIIIDLQAQTHPGPGRYAANCYCNEITLLCWNKKRKTAVHSRQYSDWIHLTDELPEFEFIFPQPAGATHWLVCLKQQLGKNGEPIDVMETEAMQIAEVGTFDKEEQALWDEQKAAENAKNAAKDNKKKAAAVVRVKAKKKG